MPEEMYRSQLMNLVNSKYIQCVVYLEHVGYTYLEWKLVITNNGYTSVHHIRTE